MHQRENSMEKIQENSIKTVAEYIIFTLCALQVEKLSKTKRDVFCGTLCTGRAMVISLVLSWHFEMSPSELHTPHKAECK